jgi:hypothetical protein
MADQTPTESTAAKKTPRRTTKKTATKKTAAKKTAAKKSPGKKTAAKKSPGKKTAAEKSPAKKTARKTSGSDAPAKKAAAKKATASRDGAEQSERRTASARTEPRRDRRDGASNDGSRGRGSQMARAALEAVRDLTGRQTQSVTGLERSDDGWRVDVEVLELERIPSTTDVLATYEVTLDQDGELQGYRRAHRYLRGSPGDE